MGRTAIEWTDATWNPVGGCSIRSPGCRNCYAQKLAGTRLKHHPLYAGTTIAAKNGPKFNGHLTRLAIGHAQWTWPARWRGSTAPKLGPGMPSLIFVGDMSDVFHEARPIADIDDVVYVGIYIGAKRSGSRRHILQFLTKRPDVMAGYWEALLGGRLLGDLVWVMSAPDNFWLGASVEDQARADERREPMRRLAAMGFATFVSYEPALGPVDWRGWEFLDQIISGGESGDGDGTQPSHPQWHRTTRDFCARHGIAYHFKQWGYWAPCEIAANRIAVFADGGTRSATWFRGASDLERTGVECMAPFGKKRAGRRLDGVEHNGFPKRREEQRDREEAAAADA